MFMLLKDLLVETERSLEAVRSELKQSYDGKESKDVLWQVYGNSSMVGVSWDLTYRRNTPSGAWKLYGSQVERANSILKSIVDKYKKTFSVELYLAKKPTGGKYSEYEQEFGGSVIIKLKNND